MEQGEEAVSAAAMPAAQAASRWSPHAEECACRKGAEQSAGKSVAVEYSHVYALGRIEMRFPRAAVEKEFAQAIGLAETAGLSDMQARHRVLAKRENRYLVRKLAWVFSIQGLDTYLLQPRDAADYDLLVEAVRPQPDAKDIDVVLGVRGPIAPPEWGSALALPIVFFDQLYSFHSDELIAAIPRPERISADDFAPAASELFWRIMQLTDNAGATDEHRALNYLAMRYPDLYGAVAEAHADNRSLSAVDVRLSPMSGARRIVDVIFCFTERRYGTTTKSFVRVDVSEEFPFLASKLAPYYDR
ncbi:MAG TPA: hypothetical protein VEC06_11260 [Paucimonas sp.]|nr:hypothetical protein [Paucimonas sp.]